MSKLLHLTNQELVSQTIYGWTRRFSSSGTSMCPSFFFRKGTRDAWGNILVGNLILVPKAFTEMKFHTVVQMRMSQVNSFNSSYLWLEIFVIFFYFWISNCTSVTALMYRPQCVQKYCLISKVRYVWRKLMKPYQRGERLMGILLTKKIKFFQLTKNDF